MIKNTGIIVIGDHALRQSDILYMSYMDTILSVTCKGHDDPDIHEIYFDSEENCKSAFNKAVEAWRDYVDAAPDHTLGVQVDGLMARPVDEVHIGAQDCATHQSENNPLFRTSLPPSGIAEA